MALSAVLPLFAGAQMLRVSATSETTITVANVKSESGKCLVKPAGVQTQWKELPAENTANGLKLKINPAEWGGQLLVLINPPAAQKINDFTPPVLKQLLINGKAVQYEGSQLTVSNKVEVKKITWIVEDADNALLGDSSSLLLDGKPQKFSVSGKKSEISFEPAMLSLGRHSVKLTVGDAAPESNCASWTVNFHHTDKSNLLLFKPGLAKIAVDSSFQGYPSKAPICDGVLELPGSSAGNDVSWASAETDTEHWIQLDLKAEAIVKEVAVYWPRLENCSRIIQVQVLENGKWVDIAETPKGGQAQTLSTVFKLVKPIKGSKFRIFQPPKGGPAGRPDILWVCEVVLR